MTESTSSRYLSGVPIWFNLKNSKNEKNSAASADHGHLTMKDIIDHMKRNHIEYDTLNVRTSPETMESVRFLSCQKLMTYTYQHGHTHIYR
jgi:hypothetical protein